MADERLLDAAAGVLTPRHVRRVARERDVRDGSSRWLPTEIGAPLLASSKCVPPTSRETKTCLHAAHRLVPGHPRDGRVGGVHRPRGHARILGVGVRVLVQRAARLGGVGRRAPAEVVGATGVEERAVRFPTAVQLKPPRPGAASARPLAANTISLLWVRPLMPLLVGPSRTTRPTERRPARPRRSSR